jgi:hypothetical protein
MGECADAGVSRRLDGNQRNRQTGCSEIAAADMFYASNTFAALMSKDSSLRGKDWRQIYALFKDERKDTQ